MPEKSRAARRKRGFVVLLWTSYCLSLIHILVMERLASGSSDLGLMTINERELKRKFEPLKAEFQCEILARDEMIVVMDKKY